MIDLKTRALVWDGAILAQAYPSHMEVSALHSIEDDLASHFLVQIDPERMANEELQNKMHHDDLHN
jgi:hypothetical protein